MHAEIAELVGIAEEVRSDPAALTRMCERLARLLGVPICSIYVRERDAARRVSGELVLRATFGQPAEQVGKVRLRVGEGLTGFAVECVRPVTVARAVSDARNRALEGLDESEHPALLAVPLVDGPTAIGALVLQRTEARAFDVNEIVLTQALAAPVVHALEQVRAMGAAEASPASRRPTELTLRGVGAVPGAALGTAALRERSLHQPLRVGSVDPGEERARLGRAIAETAEEIAKLEAWALAEAPLDRATMAQLFAPSRFVLDDARLRGRLLHAVQHGLSAERAVEQVIREYVRHLSAVDEPALVERAFEVEALGLRIHARLEGRDSGIQPGAILCATRVTVCDVLELAACHGGGALLELPADRSPGVPVAIALQLPVLCEVRELFRWVGAHDRVLLRADEGMALLNPSRVDVAAFRRG